MPKYSRRHHRRRRLRRKKAWEEEKIVASSDRFLPQVAVNSVSSTEKRNKKEANALGLAAIPGNISPPSSSVSPKSKSPAKKSPPKKKKQAKGVSSHERYKKL